MSVFWPPVYGTGATLPGAPTSLAVANAVSGPDLVLTWVAPSSAGSGTITGYAVYKGTVSGSETLLTTLGNVLTYTDAAISFATTYYYKVVAITAVGTGPKSSEASGSAVLPGAPTGLTVTPGTTLTLNWTAPASHGSTAVSAYDVYRGATSGSEVLYASLGNVLTYVDSSVTGGDTYFYKVAALNSVGPGPESTEASGTASTSGYPLPDPTTAGTAPTQPFTTGPWVYKIPGSPSLYNVSSGPNAGTSAELVSNLLAQIAAVEFAVAPNMNNIISRYVVHGGSIPWQTVSINPGSRWDSQPVGNLSVPVPANAVNGGTSDQPFIVWDLDNETVGSYTGPMIYNFWVFNVGSPPNCNTFWRAPGDGSFHTGYLPWSGETSGLASSTSGSGAHFEAGCITRADVLSGVIAHALYLVVGPTTGTPVLPAPQSDGGTSVASGGVPDGALFFIPSSVSMPGGLTAFEQMVFTCLQTYGMYACDQTGGYGVDIMMENPGPWTDYFGVSGDSSASWMSAPVLWPYDVSYAYNALNGLAGVLAEMQVLTPGANL